VAQAVVDAAAETEVPLALGGDVEAGGEDLRLGRRDSGEQVQGGALPDRDPAVSEVGSRLATDLRPRER
jgi:hypothetical protein